MPVFECQVCHSQGFYVADGVTFCETCGTESQDHGQQLVVDDETIGTFDAATASKLKRKKISDGKTKKAKGLSKARKAYLSGFKVSFTSLDAFTYILKQWTEEAILLGADDSLRRNVADLWYSYLQNTGTAFKTSQNRRTVGYRDAVASITKRKRILSSDFVHRKFKSLTRPKRRNQAEIDPDDTSISAKRARARRKRKFLESVASSDAESDAESFLSSSSFMDSSGDDSFSLSLSSLSSSQPSLSIPSLASSSSEISSGEESDVDKAETEKNIVKDVRILQRLQKMKNGRRFRSEKKLASYPRLKTVFGVFALAVFSTKNNWMTLSDLMFWAERDAISFDTNVLAIPKELKFYSFSDQKAFSSALNEPLDHFKMRKLMMNLGAFMSLKRCHLVGQQVLEILARFLFELSLPKEFMVVLQNLLPAAMLTEFKFNFPDKIRAFKNENTNPPIPSLDVYCMALILFGLKYLYNLDDVSEYKLNGQNMPGFSLIDWIKLSKFRCFLAVKHSLDLNHKYGSLLPDVETSPAVKMRSIQEQSNRLQVMKKHQSTEEETKMDKLIQLLVKWMPKTSEETEVSLGLSDVPLHDFSQDIINGKLWSEKTVNQMKQLDSYHQATISYSKWVPDRICAGFVNVGLPHESLIETTVNQRLRVGKTLADAPLNTKLKYWLLPFPVNNKKMTQDHVPVRYFESKFENVLLNSTPKNFAWILRYLAATVSSRPAEIYANLVSIEGDLMAKDRHFFGNVTQASTYCSYARHVSNKLC